jgi:hypothetical protein
MRNTYLTILQLVLWNLTQLPSFLKNEYGDIQAIFASYLVAK